MGLHCCFFACNSEICMSVANRRSMTVQVLGIRVELDEAEEVVEELQRLIQEIRRRVWSNRKFICIILCYTLVPYSYMDYVCKGYGITGG